MEGERRREKKEMKIIGNSEKINEEVKEIDGEKGKGEDFVSEEEEEVRI